MDEDEFQDDIDMMFADEFENPNPGIQANAEQAAEADDVNIPGPSSSAGVRAGGDESTEPVLKGSAVSAASKNSILVNPRQVLLMKFHLKGHKLNLRFLERKSDIKICTECALGIC